ncbi:MAG TPA: type II toxin-antitoxin system Phd/YefM family antitoxin [Thermoanaerobaculia bacterium]|jgi:prevent-host-death family protein|nr:type II toxin-antitoxin system Phd/YefM family antitoxin [Thermoanaerobaculia bacterium]
MKRHFRIATDIKPVSDFRANAAGMIEQVKASGRPLVLTQRGESAAVLLDVAVYQELIEELELLSDVRTSMKQFDEGHGVSNRDAKAGLRKRLAR